MSADVTRMKRRAAPAEREVVEVVVGGRGGGRGGGGGGGGGGALRGAGDGGADVGGWGAAYFFASQRRIALQSTPICTLTSLRTRPRRR